MNAAEIKNGVCINICVVDSVEDIDGVRLHHLPDGFQMGDFFDGEHWSPAPVAVNLNLISESARSARNNALARSDWTQLADAPVASKTAWVLYRDALRNLTLQPGFPVEISWPVAPL